MRSRRAPTLPPPTTVPNLSTGNAQGPTLDKTRPQRPHLKIHRHLELHLKSTPNSHLPKTLRKKRGRGVSNARVSYSNPRTQISEADLINIAALPPFRNEPFTDFSAPDKHRAMLDALARVRSELGRTWDLVVGGHHTQTGE